MVLMGTQTTTIMSTKRSRRRTVRGTRARRVAQDAGLTPLTPAKTAIQEQLGRVPITRASQGAPRGNERRWRSVAKDASRAAGNLNARALYRLMAWLSPAYPVGAFSYSSGIEWAVEAGDIKDAASLQQWLAAMLAEGSGFCDAVLFVHAHRAIIAGDDAALRTVAELAAALVPSKERFLETTAQGRAFLDATKAAWPCPALMRLDDVWKGPFSSPGAASIACAGHEIACE